MAGSCCYAGTYPYPTLRSATRCCSDASGENMGTPLILKLAVSGVTEVLRAFSSFGKYKVDGVRKFRGSDEISISETSDVMKILKADYEQNYFVTGIFTSSIYAEDCIFEDPTIKFRVRGTDLYERNLKLLVPFFDGASIELEKIEKRIDAEADYILATWKLRTYLKLPWKPLISIDGSTVYELDDKFQIVRHAESWNVSALEAVAQIFTPISGVVSE